MTHTGSIPSRQADAVCVVNMCSALSAMGVDVELVIPRGKALPMSELGFSGSVFDYYKVKKDFSITYLPNPFARVSRIDKKGYCLFAMCYAYISRTTLINSRFTDLAVMAHRFGFPVVFESHDFLKESGRVLFDEWIALMQKKNTKTAMIVTTQAGKQSYVDTGIPGEKIVILPNGIDIERYTMAGPQDALRKQLGLPAGKTLAGFSGSLYQGRGIEEIIWCARHMPDVFFVIVGGAPDDVVRHENFAHHSKVPNIQFVGHVVHDMVAKYLMAFDILIMPYTSVSAHPYMSPMKMFDYMAAGRPIVATDFPVVREILSHEHNAFLVAPDSGEELLRGVRWFIDNQEKARVIGNQARVDAGRYLWEKRAADYISFVKKLGWA